ncbi:MAG TPA: type II secretion system minor pseudopilin GspI [Sphingobium sp.]|uniref:type II secretion system minor pseudopilin GspI n=1 Tax=Sphingobium sp. TaxID=1912891 RepID=UPI002ED3C6A4
MSGVAPLKRFAQQGFTPSRRSAEQGVESLRRSAQQGFTLLEMLVALAIFSLAGLALVRLQAVSVRTAADLDARLLAEITARNIAFERMTDPVAVTGGGGTVMNAGREFQWTQTAAPTSDKRLMQITVTVSSGPGQSPAVLSIVRPVS